MDEKNWQNIKDIFLAALDKDAESRAAFLDENCNGDAEIRKEVESLLASHEEIEDFIETPAFDAAEVFSEDKKEKFIGNYKILKEIGAGGMGVVYLAAREDEEFRKRVAIKLVKRGLDTEDVLRRFRNERQILASLHHPNIASLLDGGTTQDGLPYFVMEYIEGSPLLQYCAERELSINERLELFRTICAAVQHAHQNLVIHRDLKPSNILITHDGELKLLDFGVAKFLNPELMGANLDQTQTQFRPMTPEYASPEQFRGGHITTASDIYSLGVILYELLTGTRPFKLKDTSPEEMMRLICDTEPPAPSLTEGEKVDDKSPVSLSPHLPFSPSQLRGDLDNIILTALRKEPLRRYKSAERFSDDIGRYLNGLPVAARPNTWRYRAGKFIRRHKVGVAAASLILLSLIGGIIVSLWQAQIARNEKEKAKTVNIFLSQMLNYSDPNTAVKKGENELITVKDVLDKAAKQLEDANFAAAPDVKAELNYIIGYNYYSQGFYEPAEKHIRTALEENSKTSDQNESDTVTARLLLASILSQRAKRAEADEIFQEAIPIVRSEFKKGNLTAAVLINSLQDFAVNRRALGNSKEAETLLRESLALEPFATSEADKKGLIVARGVLSLTLFDQGKLDEAITIQKELVAGLQRTSASETWEVGYAFTALGNYLSERDNFAEAEENLSKGEAIYRRLLDNSHLFLGDNLRIQANSLYQQNRLAEAEKKITETLRIYRAGTNPQYINFATALMIQGLILNKTGKSAEAEKILREAVEIRQKNLPPEHFLTALAKSALGECLTTQKKFTEAETLLREGYESLKNSQGAENPRTVLAQNRLNKFYEARK